MTVLGTLTPVLKSTKFMNGKSAIHKKTHMLGKHLANKASKMVPNAQKLQSGIQKLDRGMEKAEKFEAAHSDALDYGTAGLAAAPVPGARAAALGITGARQLVKGSAKLRRAREKAGRVGRAAKRGRFVAGDEMLLQN